MSTDRRSLSTLEYIAKTLGYILVICGVFYSLAIAYYEVKIIKPIVEKHEERLNKNDVDKAVQIEQLKSVNEKLDIIIRRLPGGNR